MFCARRLIDIEAEVKYGENMILERKMKLDIPDLKQQIGEFQNDYETTVPDPRTALLEFAGLMQMYNGAMKEISTKLEVLDDEFHIRHCHNPIHHLECRMKSIRSIYEKMQKLGVPPTTDAARKNVLDIAGIRVICNFIDDIYLMEKLLMRQADVALVMRKDYIETPKANGYRSLHIIVQIPVYLSNATEIIPVEIQMRTVAMDYWASLEHMLRYKNNNADTQKYAAALFECAETLAETERTMQKIHNGLTFDMSTSFPW